MDDQGTNREGGGIRFRKLRIALSAAFGILCLLLIAFWVRCFSWVDQAFVPIAPSAYVCFGSMPNVFGVGFSDKSPNGTLGTFSMPTIDWLAATSQETGTRWSGILMFDVSTDGVLMPYWFGVILSAAFGTAPWLRWRFSLRTLLIGMTVVAMLLAALVWAAK